MGVCVWVGGWVGARVRAPTRARARVTCVCFQRYGAVWKWVDGSTAFFRGQLKRKSPYTSHAISRPVCAALGANDKSVYLECSAKINAGAVCELKSRLEHEFFRSVQSTEVHLASHVPPTFPLYYVICAREERHKNLSHVTHGFLACDVLSDCFTTSDQASSRLCKRVMDPSPPSFTCHNNVQHVPYMLVCDHRHDCTDGSDEDFCVFPPCEDPSINFHCGDGQVRDW